MRSIIVVSLIIFLTAFSFRTDFLTEQKKYERVRASMNEKEAIILERLNDAGLNVDNFDILIVAFKAERMLEIYAKNKSATTYKKLIVYDICSSSGQLGPKRQSGDYQVPEGFYYIDRFNPNSNFYLSLGLNYPNQSDRIKSKAASLGGDIFIHGSCVTVGCMPMTNDKIKEIYLYALYARNNGQSKIPVYVFPFQMTDRNFKAYKEAYKSSPVLINFWTNLKRGYDLFTKDKKRLTIGFEKDGDYKY